MAAEAGVSKALPYKHFDNSEAVLAALYRRETEGLGRAVWHSLRHAAPDTDLIRLGVHVYFDEVTRRSPVLAALSRPGSNIASVADPGQAGVIFEVEVLTRFHGLDRDRAKAVAGMIQGAIVGAAGTCLAGHADRTGLEDDLVTLIVSLVDPADRRHRVRPHHRPPASSPRGATSITTTTTTMNKPAHSARTAGGPSRQVHSLDPQGEM